jgi:hypothetical protein
MTVRLMRLVAVQVCVCVCVCVCVILLACNCKQSLILLFLQDVREPDVGTLKSDIRPDQGPCKVISHSATA